SKMRFISAQFEALLTNDLWLQNAQHANRMARLLQREVSKFPQVKIVYKVEANGVFAKIPRHAIAKLQKRYFFYVWNEEESVVRWMCSFDTTAEDVQQFAKFAQIYQLSMASPVKRTAFLNWLLKRIELPANEDCTVEVWRRIPHPDTQVLGGVEIV